MDRDTAQRLVDAAEDLGFEIRLKEEYSGRGAFGGTTTAVVAESSWMVIQAAAHAVAYRHPEFEADLIEEFVEELRELRSDSLGHDVVWY